MTLRPYQVEAIRQTRQAWHAGATDVLGVAATGMGKSLIFCAMIDLMLGQRPDKRALVIAHREELVTQPQGTLLDFYPRWKFDTGIVKAERNECDQRIIFASVQTVAQPHRLARILAHGPINLLITDEGHHAAAPIYSRVYGPLREANPVMRHLGVTATPIRADGVGLRTVFQETAFSYDLRYGIQHGYLVPLRVLGISTAISLKGVKSTAGDFNQKQLADVMETDNALDLIVKSHQKYAEGRRGLAFCVSVAGAYRLAEKFQQAGIRAAAADANTPREQRRELLARFRGGDLDLLVNVGLWTEGLDLPEANVLHMARPTQSDGLYLQMMGRGTRTAPGKDDCLILDYKPKAHRRVVFAGDVLGISRDEKEVLIPSAEEEEEEGAIQGAFAFDGDFKGVDGDPLAILHQELDYLNGSPFQWTKRDRWMVLGLGGDEAGTERALAITPPADEQSLLLVAKPKGAGWPHAHVQTLAAGDFGDLTELATQTADRLGNAALVGKGRSWRGQPLTDGQRDYLLKLCRDKSSLPPLETLTKGAAAELITFYGARAALQRAGYW